MSRPPIRDVFRLANLGLEKVALACAAFSLMHASARAGESAPPEPREPVAVDQWAAQSSNLSVNEAARLSVHDDPWANPVAARLVNDDPWSANRVNSFKPVEQLHVEAQGARDVSVPHAPAAAAPSKSPRPSSALVMDGSDWNKVPRGRAPGLIASNNAWRKRIAPEGSASIERNVAKQVAEQAAEQVVKHDQRTPPATVLKFDTNLQLDPWTAPAAASKGIDNAADWKNLNLASAHEGRTCSRDWSIFSGAGCPVSGSQADPANGGVKLNNLDNRDTTGGARPQPLPGMQSSMLEQAEPAVTSGRSRFFIDAMANAPKALVESARSQIAMTADGRWRAPLASDAGNAARKYPVQRD